MNTETINAKVAQLLIENPDLPVKVRVNQCLTGYTEYEWMLGELNSVRVTAYWHMDDLFYIRDDCEDLKDMMRETLYADCFEHGHGVNDEAMERKVEQEINALDWKPCIVLEVGP